MHCKFDGPGGWKTFLMDNRIKVDVILIFNMISFSEFQVVIGRAPVEVHIGEDYEDKSSAKWFRNTSSRWNADQAPDSCSVCKQAPPCPCFVVNIRPSFHSQNLGLAVQFLDASGTSVHGNTLECNDLQLRGPNKAICLVKAKRIYDVEEKLSVCLDSG